MSELKFTQDHEWIRLEDDGWFFRLKLGNPEELDGLMDEAGYAEYVKSLE